VSIGVSRMWTSGRPVDLKPDECDFCSSHAVVHRYQCMDFQAESKNAGVLFDGTLSTVGPTNLVFQSRNYWAACADCAYYVDREDLEGLLAHTKKVLIDPDWKLQHDTHRRHQLMKHLRYTYEIFFKTRIRVAAE